MQAAGIIMECNPFHLGHEYFLKEIKKADKDMLIAAIMSGDFVQRGEPAVLTKSRRTKILLEEGVDLVLELPVRFSLGNAESFAKAAVSMLNSLPLVEKIIFGSESGDIKKLKNAADASIKAQESPEYRKALKENLKNGHTYASSSAMALSSYLKTDSDCAAADSFPNTDSVSSAADCSPNMDSVSSAAGIPLDTTLLSTPNNLLGIEYIKALSFFSSPILPETIKRSEDFEYSSASSVRELMNTKDTLPLNALPEKALEIINNPKLYPITMDDFSLLLYDRLLSLSKEELCHYEDITPELSGSIKNNLNKFSSFSRFALLLKTRNYTLARIKRNLFHILLGIKKTEKLTKIEKTEELSGTERTEDSLEKYQKIPLRVLGMKKEAAVLLKNAKAPVITTGALINSYNRENPGSYLEESIHASMLYRQAVMEKFKISLPDEYHSYPIKL